MRLAISSVSIHCPKVADAGSDLSQNNASSLSRFVCFKAKVTFMGWSRGAETILVQPIGVLRCPFDTTWVIWTRSEDARTNKAKAKTIVTKLRE